MTTRALAVTAIAIWLALGVAVQAKWDNECAIEQPGTYWNGDSWLCERNDR